MLDGRDVVVRQVARQHVDLGGADLGALALTDQLHALGRGGRAHVKLAGQVLDGKHAVALGHLGHLGGRDVDLRLGKDGRHALLKEFVFDALDVVAVDDAQPREARDAQDVAQLGQQLRRLDVVAVLLLDVHT